MNLIALALVSWSFMDLAADSTRAVATAASWSLTDLAIDPPRGGAPTPKPKPKPAEPKPEPQGDNGDVAPPGSPPTSSTTPAPATSVAQWYRLTNEPGTEGYGVLGADGYVVVEKRRTVEATGGGNEIAGDERGRFLARLNNLRAKLGLRPLGYDSGLEAYAHQNNPWQNAKRRSLHQVMAPGAMQIAFYGPSEVDSAFDGWYKSGAHRSAMLNPNVSSVGLARDGLAWTANLK